METLHNVQTLVDAILEEDRLLRERLTSCPPHLRDVRGPSGGLSFKETLAHISYWDDFTVDFFSTKLDKGSLDPTPPLDFEENSRRALASAAVRPFGEILARYLESTGALTRFLTQHWADLDTREKHDFWVPLKHRRHHRISLFQSLDRLTESKEWAAEA